jgi:stage V sporulation protein G
MPEVNTQGATPAETHEKQEASLLPMGYDVRINSLRMNGSTKGNASVTLNGQFGVRGIRVMEGTNGLFVSMPSWKDANNEYHDICFPCTKEARAEFDKAVLSAFEQARACGTNGQSQATTETLPLQYDVRIHSLHPGTGTLKGTASVNLNGQFAMRRVSIIEGSKGLFVSTPGFRGGNGMFKDYCYPCTKEARAEFNKAVLDAYQQALIQNQAQGQALSGGQQPEVHAHFEQEAPTGTGIPVMQM